MTLTKKTMEYYEQVVMKVKGKNRTQNSRKDKERRKKENPHYKSGKVARCAMLKSEWQWIKGNP